MLQLLEHVDSVRKKVGKGINPARKSEMGQFMTPLPIARFMASLFLPSTLQTARLLDAGAGIGSLSCAFLDRYAAGEFPFHRVQVFAYEIDPVLREHLSLTLEKYQAGLDLDVTVLSGDFIEEAVQQILQGRELFTHAILNPPYKKINSASHHRLLLRQVGIETVNLYSAFVALTVNLMAPGGQVVAIIPRSFCNGPYYKPFREFILSRASLKHMHLFESRDRAFKDDDVLQENIIIVLERDAPQGTVAVSTSTDARFTDTETHVFPFHHIVLKGDPEKFIHVPTTPEHRQIDSFPLVRHSLSDLCLEVSTGPVVDFRMKSHLRLMPVKGSVPLLYPCHFLGQSIEWPKPGAKKPNALLLNDETKKWLFPNGCYVVVKRFSAKEEKRRIVATVVYPFSFDSPSLGFENHLNVFHVGKQGIPEDLARGLSLFLNSTVADEQFRRFSGHTQVNATDLRLLKYPDRETLVRLGAWANGQSDLTQQKIDEKIEGALWQTTTT